MTVNTNKTSRDIKAVVFDIDGTLTTESSWISLTKGIGASWERHKEIYESFRAGKIEYADGRKEILEMYRQTGNNKRSVVLDIFEGIQLRRGVHETIKYLKPKYHLLIITGAMDVYAAIVGRRVGIEEVCFNTEFQWDENNRLVHWETKNPQEEKKLDQLKEFCKEKKITIDQCVAVGDSWNDVALFDATGNGIFIESDFEDKKLEKHAWRTIHELPELMEFL